MRAIANYNAGLVVLYQKMPRDLSLVIEGITWMQVGSDIAHALRVTNQGSPPRRACASTAPCPEA